MVFYTAYTILYDLDCWPQSSWRDQSRRLSNRMSDDVRIRFGRERDQRQKDKK